MIHQCKITLLKTRLTVSLLLLLRAYFCGSSWGRGEFPASCSGATRMAVLSGNSLVEESLMPVELTDGSGVTLVGGGHGCLAEPGLVVWPWGQTACCQETMILAKE